MPLPSPELRPALSPSQAQRALGLESINTVYRLIQRGELPAAKVGRIYRIRQQDIEAFLAGRRSDEPDVTALEEHIQKVLSQAPPLTDEQRTRLAELLRPARVGHSNDGAA